MNIKETLFMLDSFCKANNIEYMVTGTAALALLGIPSNPQDIDIKVFHLKEYQRSKLKELQFLAGLENSVYESECYSFIINGVKINAIQDYTDDCSEILSKEVILDMVDEANNACHSIGVQLVFYTLEDKMKLGRNKDKTYMLDLIANLMSLK